MNFRAGPQGSFIYCASGELPGRIEDANTIGHIAFDGRAKIASQFNKDLTLSGHRAVKDELEPSSKVAVNA